jgi:cytochrome c-type biogenesis protein CcmH/NrfF
LREVLALALLLTLIVAGVAFAAGEIPPGVDREAYLEVATTILCDCGCHPQSVHECACGRAAEMRDEIAGALNTGGPGGTRQSASQVIAGYVARHGEKIRIAPTTRGFNLVAWLGPGIGFLIAGIVVALALRRWRGAVPALPAPAGEPSAALVDDAYVKRLARELEEGR